MLSMLDIKPINFNQFMHISLSVRQKGFGLCVKLYFPCSFVCRAFWQYTIPGNSNPRSTNCVYPRELKISNHKEKRKNEIKRNVRGRNTLRKSLNLTFGACCILTPPKIFGISLAFSLHSDNFNCELRLEFSPYGQHQSNRFVPALLQTFSRNYFSIYCPKHLLPSSNGIGQ